MPKEFVTGVDLGRVEGRLLDDERVGQRVGRLPIGGRHEDPLMEFLQGPAFIHEAQGEPIKEFGVRGLLGHIAEVIGRGNDAGAEVVQPEPVDEDAGGERVGPVGDGHGKLAAPAAFVEGLPLGAGEDLEELAGGEGPLLVAVAPDVDVGVTRSSAVGHRHGGARAARVGQVKGVDGVEFEEARRDVAVREGRGRLPGLAEGPGGDEHRHLRGRGELLVIRGRERVGGQLGDGFVILLRPLARLAAHPEVGDDGAMVLREDGVVGEGDLIEGLRLEIAQRLGDERVHGELLVGEGGGDRGGGLGGEIGLGEALEPGERTGDGRVGADHHRTVDLTVDDVLVLVLLLHVVALLRAGAAREGDHRTGTIALM